MPAISIHTSPYPELTIGPVGHAIDGPDTRTEVVLLERPHGLVAGIVELPRLQVEHGGLTVDLGRREVQGVSQPGLIVRRSDTFQSSWMKYS